MKKYLLIVPHAAILAILVTYAWRQAWLANEWKRLYHTSSSQIEAVAKWKHNSHKEIQNEISPQTNP